MNEGHHKLKVAASILVTVLVLAGVGATMLFGMSKTAVREYRSGTIAQIKAVVKGEKSGSPVELKKVLLGDILNPSYKIVNAAQPGYKDLLAEAQAYAAASGAHNAVVELYNAATDSDQAPSASLLVATKKYLAVVESNYPKETEFIEKLRHLVEKIIGSTKIADIREDFEPVLLGSEQWINILHDDLDARTKQFQQELW
ncbi:hypothetical protein FWF74_01775 [Candidatus Saccharibacteria bacterium]|nr:hypothetical protein [Candidatus Saccharibacteria bacterium]MCL1963193.1 hypothetical protein [Candidatus Saccharibacteria bacterium]